MDFILESKYQPCGDQPQAIASICEGIEAGLRTQVVRGVTGSGKTFTMANIIARQNRPALVICHNKTLAAQLCNEFREFFPKNRVEFFVSYYDYYMPESYIPSRDLYIEKEMDINEEIDRLRNSATSSLAERRDTIVVASVSCIYGLGAPEDYYRLSISLRPGDEISPQKVISRLVSIQYERNDMDFARGTFRVRGDCIEVYPVYSNESGIRIEFFGDTVEKISQINVVDSRAISVLTHISIFPATHYVTDSETLRAAFGKIAQDMEREVAAMNEKGKIVEAQRLQARVSHDLEMLAEIGVCTGVENYSRYFDGRSIGDPPFTLLNYFPDDFITFIDESHMTLPQVRAMYNGDRSRKQNLVDYGWRLKSSYDNRPLRFEEFDKRVGQIVCVSATPAPYELEQSDNTVEQIIRPTGLVDPEITLHKVEGQIDHLIGEINIVTARGGRVLVTTLTKRMAEALTAYLHERNIRVKYMHSEINTLERIEILTGLKKGEFDVLVGINLLREGLDLPQVQLVAILDADKEGFLRSESSLIQTIGRAARNVLGRVIMYADNITGSMRRAIDETNRRRKLQSDYNAAHGITPKSIEHNVENTLEISRRVTDMATPKELEAEVERLSSSMKLAAGMLDFEKAIELRNEISRLKKQIERLAKAKKQQ